MQDPVSEFELRCAAANVSLRSVLRHSGVAPSTWWRWRRRGGGARTQTLFKLDRSLQALKGDEAA
jgi:hypothetical protein